MQHKRGDEMKRVFLVSVLFVGLFANMAFGQSAIQGDVQLQNGWGIGMVKSVPVFKIVESSNPAAKVDAVPILGLCGGVCFYYTNDKAAPDHDRLLTFAPIAVMMTTRVDEEGTFDPSFGVLVGMFDDALQLGWMYFAGQRNEDISRHELIFSMGFSL